MTSQELLGELLLTLVEKERKEKEVKDLNKKISALQVELSDQMVDEEVDSIEMSGIKFTPTLEQNFVLDTEEENAKWDSYPEWFDWLKQQGEDGLIQTKQTVPWNTRKKFLAEWVSQDNELPPFIKQTYFQTVKYNKSAVKRLAEESREKLAK